MRSILAIAAVALLALAGCSSPSAEPEATQTTEVITTAPVEPTETSIALGEPFTINGPNYTADVTIERVYLPAQCGDYPNTNIALEVDVEVVTGDGTREVLNTGTIRERDPDGYITRDRTVSTTCGDIEELDARDVQSGDKFRGVRWLHDDVNPESEILINTPTPQGDPIAEVFVLDLAEIDIQSASSTPDPPAAPVPPAAAPAQSSPAAAAEPYVVECLFGTPGPSRMSDGTIQSTDYCANQPGAAESRYLEGNCSDMAWRQGMGLEGDRLCGSSLFEDGALGGN
ncbi:MAG: hypothetical protein V7738_12470 [Dietzia maris]|uniref:hypothetical protein n=1 Tax=Dietzia maris TaxID=37915 RepID=UPI0030012AD3